MMEICGMEVVQTFLDAEVHEVQWASAMASLSEFVE
jgi:hypothetical protein